MKKIILSLFLLFVPTVSWASFPDVAVTVDTFTSTNNPLDQTLWGQVRASNQWKSSGGLAVATTAGSYNDIWDYYKTKLGPDVEAYLTVTNSPGDNFIWVWARFNPNTGTGYATEIEKTLHVVKLYRLDRFIRTQLGSSVSITYSAGDSIGIKCVGSTIEAWYKPNGGSWAQKIVATDTRYNSPGFFAMQGQDVANAQQVDNFGIGVFTNGKTKLQGTVKINGTFKN